MWELMFLHTWYFESKLSFCLTCVHLLFILQGPVLVITFLSQQIMSVRDAKGVVVEGDPDKVLRVMYVWVLCRDQTELDPKAAWRLLELSANSTEQFLWSINEDIPFCDVIRGKCYWMPCYVIIQSDHFFSSWMSKKKRKIIEIISPLVIYWHCWLIVVKRTYWN